MDKAGLVQLVVGREPEAILRTLAMVAYNPAIVRVLEEGGVSRFADLMTDATPKLYGSVTRDTFVAFHDETCGRILADFKTARGQKLARPRNL